MHFYSHRMDGEGKRRAVKKLSQGYTANLVWLQKLPFNYHAVLSLKEKDLFPSTAYTERMSDGLSGEMEKPLRKGHLQYTNRGLEFYFIRKFWCLSKSGPKDYTWSWSHSFKIWWRKESVTDFLGGNKERRKMRIRHLLGGRGSQQARRRATSQGEALGLSQTTCLCSGATSSALCSPSS